MSEHGRKRVSNVRDDLLLAHGLLTEQLHRTSRIQKLPMMGYTGFGCIWLTPRTLSYAPAAASYEPNTETLGATLSCDVLEVEQQEVPAGTMDDGNDGQRTTTAHLARRAADQGAHVGNHLSVP